MRMNLYKVDAKAGSRNVTIHVIAATEDQAGITTFNHFEELGMKASFVGIERVDDTLPDEMRQGLEDMLETAPTTLASFCPGFGWIAHLVPAPRLKLFAVKIHDENQRHIDTQFVIAPNRCVAVAVFAQHDNINEGEERLLIICEAIAELDDATNAGIEDLLSFGPAGMVSWDEDKGWFRL